jgi:hypothetical protein
MWLIVLRVVGVSFTSKPLSSQPTPLPGRHIQVRISFLYLTRLYDSEWWQEPTRASSKRARVRADIAKEQGSLVNPRLRAPNDIHDPSKLACCLLGDGA